MEALPYSENVTFRPIKKSKLLLMLMSLLWLFLKNVAQQLKQFQFILQLLQVVHGFYLKICMHFS